MEENINALDEISKGSSMGMDAIKFILDKTDDNNYGIRLIMKINIEKI